MGKDFMSLSVEMGRKNGHLGISKGFQIFRTDRPKRDALF